MLQDTAASAQDTPSATRSGASIDQLTASVYKIPTDLPESDGTFAWDSTTLVLVELNAGDVHGIGYTYADSTAGRLAIESLACDVVGRDPFDIPAISRAMSARLRNVGRPGIGATAISAIDNALWDLKARLLDVSLVDLIGAARNEIPAYGSGGFTSYSPGELNSQLCGWATDGFSMVKIKIGRNPREDPARVDVSRRAIGPDVELFVDANGAFDASDAIAAAAWLGDYDVRWFEEPVSSDDVPGLRAVREAVPPRMSVAAGEYGWTPIDFVRWIEGEAVDVLQADATRCLGISGFLNVAELCRAHNMPLSTHCAPSLHASLACAVLPARHIEWFHDHVRIEQLFFDGAASVDHGSVRPDRSKPGLGLELRRSDVEQYLVWKRGT